MDLYHDPIFRICPFLLLIVIIKFCDQLILFMQMYPFDELPVIGVGYRSTLQYRENTPYPHTHPLHEEKLIFSHCIV